MFSKKKKKMYLWILNNRKNHLSNVIKKTDLKIIYNSETLLRINYKRNLRGRIGNRKTIKQLLPLDSYCSNAAQYICIWRYQVLFKHVPYNWADFNSICTDTHSKTAKVVNTHTLNNYDTYYYRQILQLWDK